MSSNKPEWAGFLLRTASEVCLSIRDFDGKQSSFLLRPVRKFSSFTVTVTEQILLKVFFQKVFRPKMYLNLQRMVY